MAGHAVMTGGDRSTSVLIVGAGPVGLALALDLSNRGVDCIVIDRTDGIVRHSKMGVVSVRSMEFCRRWGIADQVRNAGFPEDYALNQVFCTSLTGHLIGISRYPSPRDEPRTDASPERRQRCPQIWFDPILQNAVARSQHATLHYDCELTGYEQSESGVIAMLRDVNTDQVSRIEAQYLVGCDGAGSDVRNSLGIQMRGDQVLNYSVGVYFRAPRLLQMHDKGTAERYLMFGEEGNWGHLTVVDGREYWRLTVMGSSEKLDMSRFDAQAWVTRCLGVESEDIRIESILPWRRSKLVAEHFRSDRVFLCGDAVHVMSPNGGYGMNTGLGDAVDLAWKLQAVLEGWGGTELLDSYETERRPVGIRNTYAAAGNFARIMTSLDWKGIGENSPQGERKRREIGPVLEEAARGNIEVLGISLGYRYEGSPICIADGTPPTADEARHYEPTSRPGHRAPHAWLEANRSTLDLFGDGFVLLKSGNQLAEPAPLVEAARRRGVPLTVVTTDDPDVTRLYERSLVLVRPDGHVAWRGDGPIEDPLSIVDTVTGHTRR